MAVTSTILQRLRRNIVKKASLILITVSNAMQMDVNMMINFFTKDAFASARSNDLSQRGKFDGSQCTIQKGYEHYPMTMVTWLGTWGYCEYYDYRLPTEAELCKISFETRVQTPILAEKFRLYLPSPNRCKPSCYSLQGWQVT